MRADNRQNPIRFWEITPEQWRLFATGLLVILAVSIDQWIRKVKA